MTAAETGYELPASKLRAANRRQSFFIPRECADLAPPYVTCKQQSSVITPGGMSQAVVSDDSHPFCFAIAHKISTTRFEMQTREVKCSCIIASGVGSRILISRISVP